LVVEDEANISRLIRAYLERDGFVVKEAPDGLEACSRLDDFEPQLVLLDLMLPRIDGWELCRRIRARSGPPGRVPVIMLTAKGEEFDRVLGLELGADDYVVKPFSPRELVARVRAVLRRASAPAVALDGQGARPDRAGQAVQPGAGIAPPGDVEFLEYPDFRINLTSRELTVRGETVPCPAKEFDLLWLLASHPDRVFTREALLEKVWRFDYYGDARTVDVHIRRIRQKIEPNPEQPAYILTVWGVGYKFSARRSRGG
jgi:two-component system response regulator ResD